MIFFQKLFVRTQFCLKTEELLDEKGFVLPECLAKNGGFCCEGHTAAKLHDEHQVNLVNFDIVMLHNSLMTPWSWT